MKDPRSVVVDEHGRPGPVATRTDTHPVTSRVVDIGDADPGMGAVTCPRQHGSGRGPKDAQEPLEGRRLEPRQVLTCEVRPTVGADPGMHDGMSPDHGEVRIVPPSPQVVADLVVRGERDPVRPGRAVRLFGEVDDNRRARTARRPPPDGRLRGPTLTRVLRRWRHRADEPRQRQDVDCRVDRGDHHRHPAAGSHRDRREDPESGPVLRP